MNLEILSILSKHVVVSQVFLRNDSPDLFNIVWDSYA
jgi:hypothetical protein